MKQINYNNLPEHMQEGARLYIEQGVNPGSFLTAVLSNDFVASFSRADDINTAMMFVWADWLYNDCPKLAFGSEAIVQAWANHGGFSGLHENQEREQLADAMQEMGLGDSAELGLEDVGNK